MAEILAAENSEMQEKLAVVKAQNELRKQSMEKRLDSLGVNTLDPDDPADMAILEDVMLENDGASVLSADPPNLEAFADCYTIQQYTNVADVDGTNYRYCYLRVTDNKGYSDTTLTHSQTANKLIGKETTVLKDILDYQFSFGFSAYLGQIPYGWIADWVIGSICTVLESLDENSIISYSGNNNIYNMSMLSVTQMMYVYVYLPNMDDWYLCGTKASNISYTRAEYVIANVNGTAVSDAKSYPTAVSRTGSDAASYVRTYIREGYHDVDYIGSFTVNAYNGATVRFTPGFATYPVNLF